jgi:hypothetical protein
MLAAVQPCPTDLISRNLESVAAAMNGSWLLDKSRSDPVGPFLKFLGLPWALQKLADSATPNRTFQLSSSGMIDTQVTSGLLGRTQRQEWFWSETPMTLPVGGTFPAFLTFHTDGRLVTKIAHAKGTILTVFEAVVSEGTHLVLSLRMICVDNSGQEVVNAKRVFTRAA